MIKTAFLRRRVLLASLMAGLALQAGMPVAAQTFPNKPFRLVVPFPAGGGTDAMARAMGEAMTRDLGQPVIVENRSGAGTAIGNDAVAKSAPDGHTLLLNTSAIAILPGLHPKLPYPPDTAFTAVTLVGRAPIVAVVRTDSALTSAQDLVAKARARPDHLTYGSAGNGTSTHLAAELLKNKAQIEMIHVPYRGSTQVVNDLLAGEIDVAFATLPSVAPLLSTGRARALAVTSPKRSPLLPDVPTFLESGVADYDADVWYGVFVPGATEPAVVEQLYTALQRAAQTESFQRRAIAEGLEITMDSPQDTARIVRTEEEKWRRVITAQSLKME